MKLYDYPAAPNPRRVNIFIAEKGIEIERVTVDLGTGEQLQESYRQKNPACDVPMLELDNGTCISQIHGITRYLEETYPQIPLLGSTAEQKALVAMWDHIAFMNGLLGVAEVFRNTAKGFADRAVVGPHNYPQSAEIAARGLQRVDNFFNDFNQRLADNEFVAGDFYSVADISVLVTCDFAGWIKKTIPEDCPHLKNWHQRISSRPAVKQNP